MKKILFTLLFLLIIFFIISNGINYFIKNNKVENYEVPGFTNFDKNKNLYNLIIDYINSNKIISVYSNIDKKIVWFENKKWEYLACLWNKDEMLEKLDFLNKKYNEVNEINCDILYSIISELNIDTIVIDYNLKIFDSIIKSDLDYIVKIYLENPYHIRNKWDIYIYNEGWWNLPNNTENYNLDEWNTIIKLNNNWILDNVFIKSI